MTASDDQPERDGGDWVWVPKRPSARQMADIIIYATVNEPTDEDMAATGAVLEFLPPTGHPEARIVIAEMMRDYRAMLAAAPPPPSSRERRLEEALSSAEAWLDRWAEHVGSCAQGHRCTCGLTAIRFEARAALNPDASEGES